MLELLEIPSDAYEKAANKYGKTLESLEQDVDILQEWLGTQPHFPEIMDRSMIRNFVISNKFSIERAKQRIDAYYTIKSIMPEIYEYLQPKLPAIQNIIQWKYRFLPLPKQTDQMNRVFFLQFPEIDKSKDLNMEASVAAIQMIQEIRAKEDCLLGDVMIADLKHFSLGLMFRMTPTLLLKLITIYEKIWSIPFKGGYIINSPSYFVQVLNIFKSLLKPKIFERVLTLIRGIHMYADDKVLLELFPKRILPKEYGGEERSLAELQVLWKLKYDEYTDRFDKWQTMTVNEALRPDKLVNDDILGFYGNFKKLNVD